MQTLFSLSGAELIKRTQDLVVVERRATMDLIEHLREIERRMLFLEMGYSSLFEFVVKHLGLSEGSAQRRISAMRLIRDVPEARAKLDSGEITLSNASQIQTVFRAAAQAQRSSLRGAQEPGIQVNDPSSLVGKTLDLDSKKRILEEISGMTQKECQSKLLELVPQAAAKLMERDRQISEEKFELKLVISKDLHDRIEELKVLLSHSLRQGGVAELLEYLVNQETKRQEKKKGVQAGTGAEARNEKPPEESEEISVRSPEIAGVAKSTATAVRTETVRSSSRQAIPRAIQREVWKRAKGCCQYPGCSSRFRLEMDHILPYAQGGESSAENLRLLCRAHNMKHAVESYGFELMSSYLESGSRRG
jgi:5-methylcytosine-specific restriction endonuclease McrA